ncbi:MAG: Plug and carboxypeptidase regulatory-like domain-containing protein, partial [Candidatus Eremiobacteraeota bacterium]|nr:Plug and carboxypeptidase regulatory-like domain-containing protein [Candidatus Eremiobacteraeota bacterium]
MVRFAFLRVVLIALIVLCQATWTLAGTTGNIDGTVRDQNGNPIANASVTMAAPSVHGQTVTTSTSGFFSALNLPPDTYAVTASKDGFDPATVYGVTVQADQTSRTEITLHPAAKVLARVTSTAAASVVSRSVTGDLYAVNSQAISNYQGANGGSEALYSQNSVVGSLPGVVKQTLGTGGGYTGQGSLSLRGGSFDQVGYELDGVPLNRGFDFYNGTTFLTNGIGALEVYTGGSPASQGRAMSGFINEIIQRGKYPGGGDITGVVGSPVFNHSVNADVYGGTPDNRFTYYVSTLAVNSDYNYVNRSNQANTSVVVPANDPGCNAFNASTNAAAALGQTGSIPQLAGGPYLNCAVTNVLTQPQFNAIVGSAPSAMERDTVANFHYNLTHNGLNDDLQALYVVGISNQSPTVVYGNIHQDPSISNNCCLTGFDGSQLTWLHGFFYRGTINQPYNPGLLATLTYPTAYGQASGPIPPTFQDSNSTQYSIAKLGYTRALNDSSFIRLYGYKAYSYWMTDAPINVGYWYQLHDNDTGVTLEYQNQINQHNLLSLNADYSRDITLRHLYVNASSG